MRNGPGALGAGVDEQIKQIRGKSEEEAGKWEWRTKFYERMQFIVYVPGCLWPPVDGTILFSIYTMALHVLRFLRYLRFLSVGMVINHGKCQDDT